MKTLIKIVFLIMIALTMTYCASLFATTEKYTARVNTWNGHNVKDLIVSWGPPSNEYTMPNGNKMYIWLTTSGDRVTTNYNYFLNQTVSQTSTSWCKTTFTVNTSNIIINNTWEGNACVSY